MTPAAVHHSTATAVHQQHARVLDAAYQRHPKRFVRKSPAPPELPTAAGINKPAERAREIHRQRAPGLQQHARRRLAATAGRGQPRHRSLRMMQAQAKVVEVHALLVQQGQHPRLHRKELIHAHISLGRRRLV